jgi:hypothetical protein
MIVRQAAAVAGMAFFLGAASAHAGPCTDRIYQTDLDVAKLLDSAAAQGSPRPNRPSPPCIASRLRGPLQPPNKMQAISPARRRRRSPRPWMRRATPMTRGIRPAARKR